MTPHRARFLVNLAVVAGTHAGLILVLVVSMFLHGCTKSRPAAAAIPIELIVATPAAESGTAALRPAPPTEPPPDPEDIAPPKPPEQKTPRPKPPPPKPPGPPRKIEVSQKRVTRPIQQKPAQPKLTAEEIRRLLERGAKPGERSSLSDADLRRLLNTSQTFAEHGAAMTPDQLYREMIRQALYAAWDQPSSGAYGLTTRMELTFNPDGTITGHRIVAPSGSTPMDESVVRAVRAVRRVSGIPADFLISNRRLVVSFELTDQ